jgi:hypothetical protein
MYEYEYTVEQKSEGKYRLLKYLMLAIDAVFVGAYFLIIYITRIIPLGALIPVFLWMLIFFTWRYVKPEYRHTVSDAHLSFRILYRGKAKKDIFRTRICDAEAIIPIDEAHLATLRDFAPEISYNALPALTSPDAYVMLFRTADGKRAEFRFRATEQALKSLKFYNSKTVIVKTEC